MARAVRLCISTSCLSHPQSHVQSSMFKAYSDHDSSLFAATLTILEREQSVWIKNCQQTELQEQPRHEKLLGRTRHPIAFNTIETTPGEKGDAFFQPQRHIHVAHIRNQTPQSSYVVITYRASGAASAHHDDPGPQQLALYTTASQPGPGWRNPAAAAAAAAAQAASVGIRQSPPRAAERSMHRRRMRHPAAVIVTAALDAACAAEPRCWQALAVVGWRPDVRALVAVSRLNALIPLARLLVRVLRDGPRQGVGQHSRRQEVPVAAQQGPRGRAAGVQGARAGHTVLRQPLHSLAVLQDTPRPLRASLPPSTVTLKHCSPDAQTSPPVAGLWVRDGCITSGAGRGAKWPGAPE